MKMSGIVRGWNYLFVLLIVLTTTICSAGKHTNKVKEDREFLTNYQLKRLIEENVLRKADIAKLPVITIFRHKLFTKLQN